MEFEYEYTKNYFGAIDPPKGFGWRLVSTLLVPVGKFGEMILAFWERPKNEKSILRRQHYLKYKVCRYGNI